MTGPNFRNTSGTCPRETIDLDNPSSWSDECDHCTEGNPPEAHLIIERRGHRSHVYICRKCYSLYNDRMRRTALEVRKTGFTLVSGRVRLWIVKKLLSLADWVGTPTGW